MNGETSASGLVGCPACGSAQTNEFFGLKGVPLQDGLLWPSKKEAIDSPTGDILLVYCRSCGHVWNRLFDPELLTFDPAYDISLFHSPLYARFCEEVASRLVRTYGLQGKTALEIACGKGDFLHALLRAGIGRAVGYDPTFVAGRSNALADQRIRIVTDYYSGKTADAAGDLICMRSALQYHRDPGGFLRGLKATLRGCPSAVVYVEVVNAAETFQNGAVWNVVYEHGCYYNPLSLATVFSGAGFDVLRLEPCLNGVCLEIDATPAKGEEGRTSDFGGTLSEWTGHLERFAEDHQRRLEQGRAQLARWCSAGKRVVLWGAGARAIGFCTTLGVRDEIPYVVDINPLRQGRFLPLTAQEVVAPEFLPKYMPEVVVATNPAFAGEIHGQVKQLGLDVEFSVL
jgi:hypothetical protein